MLKKYVNKDITKNEIEKQKIVKINLSFEKLKQNKLDMLNWK